MFTKTCAACHKLGDVGKGLGPDLAALADKSADYLLVNILDPNRAVEARYLAYTASTKDGRTRVGFLSAETATSITLVGTDGQEHTILRATSSRWSGPASRSCPRGWKRTCPSTRWPTCSRSSGRPCRPRSRRRSPGNKPEIIRAAADGSLTLPATAAEVYGPSLVFEEPYKNLGYWSSPDDRAVWAVEVPAAGRYEVWLDWACPRRGREAVHARGRRRIHDRPRRGRPRVGTNTGKPRSGN